ncbi:hypothetical protein ACQPZX_23905 [Actinoplanes sp. CA-142083]|uniref:hypothetical protein n=1 Tax=Actinoplanes sp. CA-142083 TaxID=3239903 RepID=UPI003D8E4B60
MPWYPIAAEASIKEETLDVAPVRLTVAPVPNLADADVPKAADLDLWTWDQYELKSDVAAKLGLTVGGSGNATYKSRVLVAEFSRSKSIMRPEGQLRYGTAARLIVKVSNFEAGANLTLPFIAAEAQFNRLEASAALRIEGYVGASAAKQLPKFGSFDVESYVKLMDALNALTESIGADVDNIRPVRLWTWAEADDSGKAVDDRLTSAVGTMWALTQIAEGKPVAEALARYRDEDDTVAQDAIQATYNHIVNSDEAPGGQARARAKELLDGYKARHGFLF